MRDAGKGISAIPLSLKRSEICKKRGCAKPIACWRMSSWSRRCTPRSAAGGGKVPDAKTMGKWGPAVGPAVIAQLHQRLIEIARAAHVVEGRKMRVDTTVVETNVHYPTDSSLLGDGVR